MESPCIVHREADLISELPIPRLVRVIAKTASGSGYGTGFRLGPRRVLTALHVVKGASSIKVQDREDREGAEWEPSEAKCIWPKPDTEAPLDVAVLTTEPAREIEAWDEFSKKPLAQRIRWDSKGFPVTKKGQQKARGLFGEAIEFSDSDKQFELTVENGLLDEVNDWQGISGAPVIIEGALHGVIGKGPKAFRGQRLNAVPISALLKLEDFCQALIDDEAAECPDDDFYFDEVEKLLRRSEAAGLEIIRQHEDWKPLSELPVEPRARALAEVICRKSLMGCVAACLSDAYCKLVDTSAIDAATIVLEIMNHALPSACLNHPPSPMSNTGSNQLELDVTSSIMADIVLAAIEKRPMRLNPPTNPHRHFPIPELQVPSVEKLLGIDPRGEQEAFLIVQEIENRLAFDTGSGKVHNDVLKFIARMPGHNSFLFPNSLLDFLDRQPKEKKLDAVIRIINGRLADVAKHGGRFFLITEPSPKYGEDFHHTLRDRLTELRQVTLSLDLDQLDRDEEINRAIQRAFIKRALGKETPE